LNIRDRSSIALSLRKSSFQLWISPRIALPASSDMAGLKLMKYFHLNAGCHSARKQVSAKLIPQ
jgi:hypothetical protein